jgi:hypothetical protein
MLDMWTAMVAIAGLIVIGGLAVVAVVALLWQRKRFDAQEQLLAHIEDCAACVRRAAESQAQATALLEEMVRYQRQEAQLLRRLAEKDESFRSVSAS